MIDSLKRIGWILLLLIPLGVIQLSFSDAPNIIPIPYYPDKPPDFVDNLEVNDKLVYSEALLKGQVQGPEDIVIDKTGNLYISNSDGNILILRATGELDTLVSTIGRPLGLAFSPKGNLIVCHENMGLISINASGRITQLAGKDKGIHLADDLAISSKGIVYFSDATIFEGLNNFYYDILIHKPFGRVFSYNLITNEINLLLDSLYFANGITISPKEEYILISESSSYQIRKYWLKGNLAGTQEIILNNMIGFPDGINNSKDGNYWVSMASPRKWSVDNLYHPYVWVKQILKYIPESFRPGPEMYGLIIKIDGQGNILESLHDPLGKVLHTITNTVEFEYTLYMGSLYNDTIGKLSLNNETF